MSRAERWIIRFVLLFIAMTVALNKVCQNSNNAIAIATKTPTTQGFTWNKDDVEQEVWNTLRTVFSEQATAAIMGNMSGESGVCPFRFETMDYEESYKLNELYKDNENKFVYSSYGYGLCGWSGIQNKQRLWDYCEEHGYSIDNPKAQCLFLIQDLKNAKNHCYERLQMYELEDLVSATEDFRQSYEASICSELSQYNRCKNAKTIFATYCEDIEDIPTVSHIPYNYDITLKVKAMNEEIENANWND